MKTLAEKLNSAGDRAHVHKSEVILIPVSARGRGRVSKLKVYLAPHPGGQDGCVPFVEDGTERAWYNESAALSWERWQAISSCHAPA